MGKKGVINVNHQHVQTGWRQAIFHSGIFFHEWKWNLWSACLKCFSRKNCCLQLQRSLFEFKARRLIARALVRRTQTKEQKTFKFICFHLSTTTRHPHWAVHCTTLHISPRLKQSRQVQMKLFCGKKAKWSSPTPGALRVEKLIKREQAHNLHKYWMRCLFLQRALFLRQSCGMSCTNEKAELASNLCTRFSSGLTFPATNESESRERKGISSTNGLLTLVTSSHSSPFLTFVSRLPGYIHYRRRRRLNDALY